ncbi:hypothetical protein QKW35_04040 [Pontibacterium granulatum]|uniref:hypothetical protein n=1 Tax=Pontibacterium granulatum TaxID=2036029 RepID=UPI00249CDC1B|nr:hypothetical protein [Pontibacterium granulatum]MDI3323541.1 hypothetical protein [Pontibacterium granulatum]
MIIAINNLPNDTSLHEVCELFAGDNRIENISFSSEGNPDRIIAWVRFNQMSRVELNRNVFRLNHHFHKTRRLEAYAPLFFV